MVASRETRFYSALMLWLLRSMIRVYQCTLSPLLGLLCGPDSGCRFTPTCSAYFLEAVELHGIRDGSWLGLKRLARCQPWGGCGYGPVADRGECNIEHAVSGIGESDEWPLACIYGSI